MAEDDLPPEHFYTQQLCVPQLQPIVQTLEKTYRKNVKNATGDRFSVQYAFIPLALISASCQTDHVVPMPDTEYLFLFSKAVSVAIKGHLFRTINIAPERKVSGKKNNNVGEVGEP